MKKILALVLALCLMMAAVPVFAETAEEAQSSGLMDAISGILGGEGGLAEKASGLLEWLSGLKDSFTGTDSQFSKILSTLGEKIQGLLQPGEEALGSLVSGLGEKFSGLGDVDLGGILGGIFGGDGEGEGLDLSGLTKFLGGDGEGEGFDLGGLADGLSGLLGGSGEEGEGGFDLGGLVEGLGDMLGSSGEEGEEVPEEDMDDLAATLEQMNREAEAETGEGVPNRKDAESVEEFYGDWLEYKFVYDGEDYDMDGNTEGVHIAENTYYITDNGEKAEYYAYPETAELTIRDGVLKVNADGHWTTFALTEDGELVMVGSSLMSYFVRVEQ